MVNSRPISRIESEDPATRLAVLIDADNAQAAIIEGLLAEIARFGEATVKRIYGTHLAPQRGLEEGASEARHQAGAAIRLHHGKAGFAAVWLQETFRPGSCQIRRLLHRRAGSRGFNPESAVRPHEVTL